MLRNNLMNNESKEAKDSDGKLPVEDDLRNQLGLIGHVVDILGLRDLKIIKDSLQDDKKVKKATKSDAKTRYTNSTTAWQGSR